MIWTMVGVVVLTMVVAILWYVIRRLGARIRYLEEIVERYAHYAWQQQRKYRDQEINSYYKSIGYK